MPSGSRSFDFNDGIYNYRLAGTVSWSISGSTVTWTMSYTTYEWVTKQGSYYCFQGLTNSAVRLSVGSDSAENAQQYTGYSAGTHSSRSSAGWVYAKSGTLSINTPLAAGAVSVELTIVVPDRSTTLTFTLAWNVTYDGNGSTGGSTSAQLKATQSSITLRNNGFTRTNYRFLGWNTAADGSGTSYAEGATYSEDAALTLYAQWRKNNIPLFVNPVGSDVHQIEKAYANIPGVGVKEVTVYANVGGEIIKFE